MGIKAGGGGEPRKPRALAHQRRVGAAGEAAEMGGESGGLAGEREMGAGGLDDAGIVAGDGDVGERGWGEVAQDARSARGKADLSTTSGSKQGCMVLRRAGV